MVYWADTKVMIPSLSLSHAIQKDFNHCCNCNYMYVNNICIPFWCFTEFSNCGYSGELKLKLFENFRNKQAREKSLSKWHTSKRFISVKPIRILNSEGGACQDRKCKNPGPALCWKYRIAQQIKRKIKKDPLSRFVGSRQTHYRSYGGIRWKGFWEGD